MKNKIQSTFHVYEAGVEQPIVFLHNGGGTFLNWSYQLDYFSSTYHVIAPDLPGFGMSPKPAHPLTLDFYVQGLADFLDTMQINNPILVGNCIGSSIALEFTLRYPKRVKALVLFNVCGGVPMLSPGLKFWAGMRPSTRLGRWLHRSLLDIASHPMLRKFGSSILYAETEPPLHPKLKEFTQRQRHEPALRNSLYWLAMGLDSFSTFTQPRQKPTSFPPVLLGWGKQNKVLNVRWAHVLAKWLNPDPFWLMDDTGHMPMYEQPEQVNAMLGDFFKKRIISHSLHIK